MKAGEMFMVQYCAEHGSFRVMQLRTCLALAQIDLKAGKPHGWVVVDYAALEGEAYSKMKVLKGKGEER